LDKFFFDPEKRGGIMAHTISAVLCNNGQLDPINPMSVSREARLVNLGKDISRIDSFLNHFDNTDRTDEDLINPVMRDAFKGIFKAYKRTQDEASKVDNCHSDGLLQLWSLGPRIKKLELLYAMFDKAERLRSEFDGQVSSLQSSFQNHQNAHKGKGAISKRFQVLDSSVNAAQNTEFARYVAFQNDMESKRLWMERIKQSTDLFTRPKSLDDISCSSTFLKFCVELFAQKSEYELTAFESLLSHLKKSYDIDEDAKIEEMRNFLLQDILPDKIKKLENPKLFFHLVRKVAENGKIPIAGWDKEWAKNNWEKHLQKHPHHILLALSGYETYQRNQMLKIIWENLLTKTSISTHNQWPICARLLHTVRENPAVFLMRHTGNKIFECDLHSHHVDEIVEELVIRNSIYNSICSIRHKIPRCSPIVCQLDTRLQTIGEALITYPQLLTAEQKVKLESAHGIFSALLLDYEHGRRPEAKELNFLIEFITDAFLSDFCSVPSQEVQFDPQLVNQITSLVQSSGMTGFYPFEVSGAELVFCPCPIQIATRIELASSIGRSLTLPFSKVHVVNYTPLDIKKELKKVIKDWPEKVKTYEQSSEFDKLIQQLEQLPPPFVVQIKDFIGRCNSGAEEDESVLGDLILKNIPNLPFTVAKKKMQEIIFIILDYSNGTLFKDTCTKYDQSHPPLIGIAFPKFDFNQNVSKNFDQRSEFPTSFKHLWALFNLITNNAETQDSCRLFFKEPKSDSSLFQFIEMSSYFSSSSCSRTDLDLDVPFTPSFLKTLLTSKILDEAKAHLKFKIGLASDPLEEAEARVETIKTMIKKALDSNNALTPNMLISGVYSLLKS
jgi:hypothetical protein